jgi:hypothetical protein
MWQPDRYWDIIFTADVFQEDTMMRTLLIAGLLIAGQMALADGSPAPVPHPEQEAVVVQDTEAVPAAAEEQALPETEAAPEVPAPVEAAPSPVFPTLPPIEIDPELQRQAEIFGRVLQESIERMRPQIEAQAEVLKGQAEEQVRLMRPVIEEYTRIGLDMAIQALEQVRKAMETRSTAEPARTEPAEATGPVSV